MNLVRLVLLTLAKGLVAGTVTGLGLGVGQDLWKLAKNKFGFSQEEEKPTTTQS